MSYTFSTVKQHERAHMTAFAELKTKKARIAHIRSMVSANEKWAVKGLLRIFERQTADEQESENTRYHNKVGFTGADAEILTSFAKRVLGGKDLTEKQMKYVFKLMPKYARQLNEIAENERRAA